MTDVATKLANAGAADTGGAEARAGRRRRQPVGAVNGSMPLYSDPRAVHSRTHGDVGVLVGPTDFGFAAGAPLVQLTVDEFARAALDYPIVFFGADHQPYAVTGLEPGRNLFVTGGAYRADAYVPAYLRRYPFVFARDENGGGNGGDTGGHNGPTLILCLDHASDRVVGAGAPGAARLFHGEALSEVTQQAMRFCETYEAAQGRTRILIDLLIDHDLLEPKRVHYTPAGSSEPQLLLDFMTVARDRFDALSGEAFLRLRLAGALPAIFGQIASQAKWEALAAGLRR